MNEVTCAATVVSAVLQSGKKFFWCWNGCEIAIASITLQSLLLLVL